MKSKIIANFTFILSLVSCISATKKSPDLPIIDIENSLNCFKISELSHHAKSIRYLLLETTNSSLVSNNIRNIYLEKDKVFVVDDAPFLKVFDAHTGKYLYNIGKKGQGPGELHRLTSVDINVSENKILLCCSDIVHCFDLEGNFLRKIELPNPTNETDNPCAPVATLGDNYFANIMYVVGEQTNLIFIFNECQEIIDSLKCYDNPIQHEVYKAWNAHDQGGKFYRAINSVHYYRGFTDTLFSFNNIDKRFDPSYVINYGKHKSKLDFNPGKENPDLIKIYAINENEEYIFLDFNTTKASPQPYEDEIFRDGKFIKFFNQSIFGIYDKKKGSLHFLLQSIPGIPGLKNDLNGGVPFFIRNVTSRGQLVDYYQAYKFLELAERVPNADDSFLQIAKHISEDDNPIIIIAE